MAAAAFLLFGFLSFGGQWWYQRQSCWKGKYWRRQVLRSTEETGPLPSCCLDDEPDSTVGLTVDDRVKNKKKGRKHKRSSRDRTRRKIEDDFAQAFYQTELGPGPERKLMVKSEKGELFKFELD